MSGVPDSIVALLRGAGWQAPPDDGARDPAGERLLASLAGLSLGKTGAGRETAASDVAFYEQPCEPDEDESLEGLPWRGRTGPLRAVADAHHNHMIVLLDAAGAAMSACRTASSIGWARRWARRWNGCCWASATVRR